MPPTPSSAPRTVALSQALTRRHHATEAARVAHDLATSLDTEATVAARAVENPYYTPPTNLAADRRACARRRLDRLTSHLDALEQNATQRPRCQADACRNEAHRDSLAEYPLCHLHHDPAHPAGVPFAEEPTLRQQVTARQAQHGILMTDTDPDREAPTPPPATVTTVNYEVTALDPAALPPAPVLTAPVAGTYTVTLTPDGYVLTLIRPCGPTPSPTETAPMPPEALDPNAPTPSPQPAAARAEQAASAKGPTPSLASNGPIMVLPARPARTPEPPYYAAALEEAKHAQALADGLAFVSQAPTPELAAALFRHLTALANLLAGRLDSLAARAHEAARRG